MINTAVIPVAGLATRMLPFTKEQPKAMLPLFVKAGIKPTVQIIFEQLYAANIRKFIFIVGRGKRVIEDHFTPDYAFLKSLRNNGMRKELSEFYEKIEAFISRMDQSITSQGIWSCCAVSEALR